MTEDKLSIGEMCASFDVTARALRFYETRGLLTPERRGQTRWYGHRDQTRLSLILRGKNYGLSLQEISALLELYDPANENEVQLIAARDVGRRQLAILQTRQDTLTSAIADLETEIETIERCLDRVPA